MSLTLKDIVDRGYFPIELPPPFNTAQFANYLSGITTRLPFSSSRGTRTSKPELYNLVRTGSLRRELSILNPIQFSYLAKCVVDNWTELEEKASDSKISLTTPVLSADKRALTRAHGLEVRAEKRAELRSRGRYLLVADVVRFYPGVYTHSIPWALHGKDVAKRNRSPSLLGNEIDELVRNCQDGQTNGIPIGPDTSLLIAEILLSTVDRKLSQRRLKGIRYVDDYELVFDTEADALNALSKLQHALLDFELHLNPAQTRILTLPQRMEEPWVTELKQMELNPRSVHFRSQLLTFFDRSFELSREFPTENVLKYSAGRIGSTRIPERHYELAEDLLIQCARVEAGALPFVLASILNSPITGAARFARRKELLHGLIIEHAPQRHSSEVAWSLWAAIALRVPLPAKVVRPILEMEDSVTALLLLHARAERLVKNPSDVDVLRSAMTATSLYDSEWLLSYEANVKGWLTGPGGDYVAADGNFGLLKAAGVSFYDVTQTVLPSPASGTTAAGYLGRITDGYSEPDAEEEVPDWDDSEYA